jgi:hypothetical protein
MIKYITISALVFTLSSMQINLFAQGNYTVSNPCLEHQKVQLITV